LGSHPIYVAPNVAQWTNFTPAQATKLLAALTAEPTITKKLLGMVHGSFTDQSVDFSYTYEPTAQTLEVTIVATHSLKTKLAGHEAIFEVLNDAIDKYLLA
jgi:hypothetical protein